MSSARERGLAGLVSPAHHADVKVLHQLVKRAYAFAGELPAIEKHQAGFAWQHGDQLAELQIGRGLKDPLPRGESESDVTDRGCGNRAHPPGVPRGPAVAQDQVGAL